MLCTWGARTPASVCKLWLGSVGGAASLQALAAWSIELARVARNDDHPWNEGLMLDALVAAHPTLAPTLKAGVSISLNGVIEPNLSTAIPDGAEIYLIQRIKGG